MDSSTTPTTPEAPLASSESASKASSRRLPRLVLPVPGSPSPQQMYGNPYTANLNMPPGQNPFNYMYPAKAGEFMFKQFNGFRDFTMNTAKSGMSFGEKIAFWMYNKTRAMSRNWFTHIFLFIVILIYSVGGAMIFVAVEGQAEEILLADMRNERYKLIRQLRESAIKMPERTSEEEWEGEASRQLMNYEETVIEWHKNNSLLRGEKVWTIFNAAFYCATIYTTIGYGHMYPTTHTGRALTIVYAIIGIPLFLIILTDFGKLFTRAIKFVWAFVRRLYYTGSCKKVRRTAPVQDFFKGAQMMYEIATFRRPSQWDGNNLENGQQNLPPNYGPRGPTSIDGSTPTTPAPSNYAIDDEFNLPISVAILMLLIYIFLGAVIFHMWEEWDFFTSFYFVFISMSTIGFGDYVPKHPLCILVSIIYLVFGLALMSMCINVVQLKLSDTFRQASAKIGATIGLTIADEDGTITPIPPPPVDIVEVHNAK